VRDASLHQYLSPEHAKAMSGNNSQGPVYKVYVSVQTAAAEPAGVVALSPFSSQYAGSLCLFHMSQAAAVNAHYPMQPHCLHA
jgi:hypothetical protein